MRKYIRRAGLLFFQQLCPAFSPQDNHRSPELKCLNLCKKSTFHLQKRRGAAPQQKEVFMVISEAITERNRRRPPFKNGTEKTLYPKGKVFHFWDCFYRAESILLRKIIHSRISDLAFLRSSIARYLRSSAGLLPTRKRSRRKVVIA